MYVIQHCFICRPSDSTVSEDAGSWKTEENKIAEMWQKYSKRTVRNPRVTIRAEIRENIRPHLSPIADRSCEDICYRQIRLKKLTIWKKSFLYRFTRWFFMMHLQTPEPHQVAKHPNAYTVHYTFAWCKSPVSNFRYLTHTVMNGRCVRAESCDAGTGVGVPGKNLTGFFPDFSTAQYHVTGTQPCPQKNAGHC